MNKIRGYTRVYEINKDNIISNLTRYLVCNKYYTSTFVNLEVNEVQSMVK